MKCSTRDFRGVFGSWVEVGWDKFDLILTRIWFQFRVSWVGPCRDYGCVWFGVHRPRLRSKRRSRTKRGQSLTAYLTAGSVLQCKWKSSPPPTFTALRRRKSKNLPTCHWQVTYRFDSFLLPSCFFPNRADITAQLGWPPELSPALIGRRSSGVPCRPSDLDIAGLWSFPSRPRIQALAYSLPVVVTCPGPRRRYSCPITVACSLPLVALTAGCRARFWRQWMV
jgi:hypothetical protein